MINEVQRLGLIRLDEMINELDREGLVELARDNFLMEVREEEG